MQPTDCQFALAHYFEAVLLVKRHIPGVFGLEVAWQAISIGPSQRRLYQHAANALTLVGRIDAKRPQIPVLSWRSPRVSRVRVGRNP